MATTSKLRTMMEFTRKRKKGVDSKTAKIWVSDCGHYQITWRNEVFGVAIPSQYQAMVRCYAEPYSDAQFWTFVGRRGPYRKLNAAIEASEKHQRLWDYAMKVSESERKGRADRLRVVDAKARVGSGPTSQRVMSSLPVWVRGKANNILMNQLFPRPGSVVEEDDECLDQKDSSTPEDDSTKLLSDPTDLSLSTEQKSSSRRPRKSSSVSQKTPLSTPASVATAEEKSTTQKKSRMSSKATNSAAESSVLSVMEPVVSPGRSSRKRTNSRSKSTSKKRSGSKRSSKPTETVSAS